MASDLLRTSIGWVTATAGVVALVAWACRRGSAALRHALWAMALGPVMARAGRGAGGAGGAGGGPARRRWLMRRWCCRHAASQPVARANALAPDRARRHAAPVTTPARTTAIPAEVCELASGFGCRRLSLDVGAAVSMGGRRGVGVLARGSGIGGRCGSCGGWRCFRRSRSCGRGWRRGRSRWAAAGAGGADLRGHHCAGRDRVAPALAGAATWF